LQDKHFLPKYKKYVAKRLRQCLPEEIGLANTSLYPSVHHYCNLLIDAKTLDEMEHLTKNVILLLCTSPKNKWTDLSWIFHKFHPRLRGFPVKAPEECTTLQDYLVYVLSHFEDIKATKRCLEDLAVIKNNSFLTLIGEAIAKNAQSASCKGLGCWLYLAAQICAVEHFEYDENLKPLLTLSIDETISVVIPDYFYDMHTLKGKSLKRSQVHWFKSCCRVNYYVQLPSDHLYDPLKYGLNVDGVTGSGGITQQELILPGGIIQTQDKPYA
jgi:hypothetical protein